MFIEKITLSGILGVKDVKEHQFSYHGDLSNDQEEFVNTVDYSFIEGFSYIFDSYFDENFDFRQSITNPLDPFVEIKLWQRNTDNESNYPWLLKNELILKRNLKHPKELTINGKKTDIRDFHEALSNLGYLNIEALQIHRLTEHEVTKLGYLVGDDLWSMLMKIIACEELIEMTERKQGIVKRRALKRSFDNYASKVERILPKKMKLRTDILTQLTLKNNFFSVIDILQNRIQVYIDYEKTNLDEEIDPLWNEITANNFDRYGKLKNFEVFCQQLMNIRFMKEKAEQTQITLDGEISNVTQYTPTSTHVDDIIEIVIESDEITSTLTIDDEENVEASAWKILINDNGDENALLDAIIEMSNEIRSSKVEYCDAIESKINELETQIENSNQISIGIFEDYRKKEKTIIKDYLKLEDQIINKRAKIGEVLEKLTGATYEAQIPMKYKADLINIDDLVRVEESLANDYIGPLFLYLEPNKITCQLWPQLMRTTNILFFRTLQSAERMAHMFIEFKANPSYIAIGVDEYLKSLKESAEIELGTEEVVTAKVLIKKETPRSMKKVLTNLLQFIVHTEANEWRYDVIDVLNITCYTKITSTIYHEGNTAVVGQLSNTLWTKLDPKTNPIQALQDFYQQMEERNKLCEEISGLEDIREKVRKEIGPELQSLEKKLVKEKSNKISDSILHSILSAGKNNLRDKLKKIEALQELDGIDETMDELRDKLENLSFIYTKYSQDEKPLALDIVNEFLESSFNDHPQLFAHMNGDLYDKKQKSINTKSKLFSGFYDSISHQIRGMFEWQISKCDSQYLLEPILSSATNSKLTLLQAKKNLLESVEKSLQECTKGCKTIIRHDNSKLATEYKNRKDEEVIAKIGELYEELLREKGEKNLRLNNLTAESYQKLVASIKKVPQYGQQEVYTPLDVKKRAYPLMNFLVVKMLRDTVHHFKISYNVIFSEYLSQSALFFYTHGEINEEVEEDKFSWNCFDMTRLKSIDFVDKWEGGQKSKIGLEKIKQIKAFLLILHIINYISIFKFIIVSDKIFEDLSPPLENKLRAFLKTISTYVQVTIIEEQSEQEENTQADEDERMDISA